MSDPNAMNEAVKKRLAHLIFSLCEGEVMLIDRDQRIEELEAELEALRQNSSEGQEVSKAPTLQELKTA